jgi:hypothetical protein
MLVSSLVLELLLRGPSATLEPRAPDAAPAEAQQRGRGAGVDEIRAALQRRLDFDIVLAARE